LLFALDAPPDWAQYEDTDGAAEVSWISPCRSGVLHVHAEAVADMRDLPNLSRMLDGFLTLHQRPVATDELLKVKVPGCLCFAWQYADAEQRRAVRTWVLGNEQAWAFVSFHCSLEQEYGLRPTVDAMITSFRFTL